MECREEKGPGRAAVAEEDKTEKVLLVVWLGKRGRVCQKPSGFESGRSVYGIIFYNVPLSPLSSVVRSCALKTARHPGVNSLAPGLLQRSFSVLRRRSSDFYVLLDAELGQGLFNAQGC